MKKISFLCLLLFTSCTLQKAVIPRLEHTLKEETIQEKKAPFTPLSFNEKTTQWGAEYLVGQELIKELDLFRAITSLKKARILCSDDERQKEVQYGLIYAYFLAKKYETATALFEKSILAVNPSTFPPYDDLLLILYTSYRAQEERNKAQAVYNKIYYHNEEKAKKLLLYEDFKQFNKEELPKEFDLNFLKSPYTAGTLNALLPGLGYAYAEQYQTGITSFCLNALFIAATIEFARRDLIAPALIAFSFECGWYGGGIKGAFDAVRERNSSIYNKRATTYMNKEKVFPILQLEYGF